MVYIPEVAPREPPTKDSARASEQTVCTPPIVFDETALLNEIAFASSEGYRVILQKPHA